jgi:hypothetical protein
MKYKKNFKKEFNFNKPLFIRFKLITIDGLKNSSKGI